MNLVAALRARLLARADSEHEQAILRIVIFALVLTYMAEVALKECLARERAGVA